MKGLLVKLKRVDSSITKQITNVNRIQKEINNHEVNKDQDESINDSYAYGPTYSGL